MLRSQPRWASSFMTISKRSEPSEVCWRVLEASSTRVLTCAIFGASASGVELRVGYVVDAPLHSQIVTDIESARVLASHWLDAVRTSAKGDHRSLTAMAFCCMDCKQEIEGHPWWYDPTAYAMNVGPQATQLIGVSQRPDAPSPVSAPFHKACLERQLGRRVDS
jgi:hypothetical protein